MKKTAVFIVFSFLISGGGFPQTPLPSTIVFYGALSNSEDAAIITMTDELFYSQLQALPNYTLVDRRNIPFSEEVLASQGEAIVFHAEIMQEGAAWDCTLYAMVPSANKSAAYTRKYDTYYRILTDAKGSLSSLLGSLEGDGAAPRVESQGRLPLSLASLAGNWSGGRDINKVVLLRGGRGFVIFKNGASMNIEVKIEDSQVIVLQTSKPNASFYPDMPRDVALLVAKEAPPIQWNFSLTDADTLTGAQKTVRLPQDSDSLEAAEVPAIWKRRP
ncbi:MAG: hypothetical protein LBR23_01490 [Spirochaetaceae bacterium]|jgi:hypothetical protein|nr:hypothetical protein [Spirochaetaceae bacterium]